MQNHLPIRAVNGDSPEHSVLSIQNSRFSDGPNFRPLYGKQGETSRTDVFLREANAWDAVTRQTATFVGRFITRVAPVRKDCSHLSCFAALMDCFCMWTMCMRSTCMTHTELTNYTRTLTPTIVNAAGQNVHIAISDVNFWIKPVGAAGLHPLVMCFCSLQRFAFGDNVILLLPEEQYDGAGVLLGRQLGEALFNDAGPAFRPQANWMFLNANTDPRNLRVFGTTLPLPVPAVPLPGVPPLPLPPQVQQHVNLARVPLDSRDGGGDIAQAAIELIVQSAMSITADNTFGVPLGGIPGAILVRSLNFTSDIAVGVWDPNTQTTCPSKGFSLDLHHAVRWGQCPIDTQIADHMAPRAFQKLSRYTRTKQKVMRAELIGFPHCAGALYDFGLSFLSSFSYKFFLFHLFFFFLVNILELRPPLCQLPAAVGIGFLFVHWRAQSTYSFILTLFLCVCMIYRSKRR